MPRRELTPEALVEIANGLNSLNEGQTVELEWLEDSEGDERPQFWVVTEDVSHDQLLDAAIWMAHNSDRWLIRKQVETHGISWAAVMELFRLGRVVRRRRPMNLDEWEYKLP